MFLNIAKTHKQLIPVTYKWGVLPCPFYAHFINIERIQGTSALYKIFIQKVVECSNATVVVTQQQNY